MRLMSDKVRFSVWLTLVWQWTPLKSGAEPSLSSDTRERILEWYAVRNFSGAKCVIKCIALSPADSAGLSAGRSSLASWSGDRLTACVHCSGTLSEHRPRYHSPLLVRTSQTLEMNKPKTHRFIDFYIFAIFVKKILSNSKVDRMLFIIFDYWRIIVSRADGVAPARILAENVESRAEIRSVGFRCLAVERLAFEIWSLDAKPRNAEEQRFKGAFELAGGHLFLPAEECEFARKQKVLTQC